MTEEVLFHAVLAQPPPERAAYLVGHCTDPELRRRVEDLLAAHDKPAGPLDVSPATGAYGPSVPPVADASGSPGKVIGPYKLLQLLGEGGMGEVWVAEQERPVKRRVALKLIKPGMDSQQVIARFEAERQALALMDHTNIAKVLDAGTTAEGRPYFAMELVKGVPITKYCDELHLSVRERLDLFVPVCQAIQHAHQKGVIHRDIKPSNVLVAIQDGKPVPKVIDFGVAKALHQRLTERSMYTEIGAVVGTLEYMSPEQAELSALDVDTRADVYALGVLLYELLTGSTPLDRKRLRSAAYDEMLRIIREEEPPKPSTRLSQSGEKLPSIAAQRRTEPAKLSKLVRGEIDWIVMKALEKDRSRRYETANGFARDLQRYLADETVEACPPAVAYRMRKFVRRHTAGVAAAATIAMLLATGVTISTWLAFWAVQAERRAREEATAAESARQAEAAQRAEVERQRDRAAAARQRTREALDAMVSNVAGESLATQKAISSEQKAFLQNVLKYYEEFAAEPGEDRQGRERLAKAHLRLGMIRYRLGLHQDGVAVLRRAAELFTSLAADIPAMTEYRRDLARSQAQLGILLTDLGKWAEAEAAYRAAITAQEKLAADLPAMPAYRHDLAHSQDNLGNLLVRLGRLPEAEAAYRSAISVNRTLALDFPTVPDYRWELANSETNLGSLLARLGRRPEGEAVYRAALAVQEKLAADFPAAPAYRLDLARGQTNLGLLLASAGRRAEAEAAHRASIAVLEKLAADFPTVPDYAIHLGGSYCNLGNVASAGGNGAAALEWHERAVSCLAPVVAAEPRLGTARQFLRNSHWCRALDLMRLHRNADAVVDWDTALRLDDGSGRLFMRVGRAGCLAHLGRLADAVKEAGEVVADTAATAGNVYDSACVFAVASVVNGDTAAESHAARAVELLQRAVAKGYADIAHLVRDPDLAAIRNRADFAELLWDLADMPALPAAEGAKP